MSSTDREPGRLRQARWALAVVAAFAGVWTFAHLVSSRSSLGFPLVNHDVAFNLYTGRLIAAGRRLYVDRFEVNPPTIMFLSAGVDQVARWLRLSPVLLFHACVLALGGLGLSAIDRLYQARDDARGLLLMGLAYLLVLVGCGLPGDPGLTYAFGQREQLFLLLFIPYLLARMGHPGDGSLPRWLLFGTALFASFKPHFVALLLVVEAMRWPRRPQRHEVTLLGAGFLLPFLVLFLRSPASLLGFVRTVLSTHVGGAYAAFDEPYLACLSSPVHLWLVGYAITAAVVIGWANRRGPASVTAGLPSRALLASVSLPLVAYLAVCHQHKFWDYHFIPVLGLLLVLTVAALLDLLATCPPRCSTLATGIAAGVLVACLGLAMRQTRLLAADWQNERGSFPGAALMRIAPLLTPGSRTLYYSTSNLHVRLAYLLHQQTVGPWGHDFTYPSMVRNPDAGERARLIADYCARQRELIRVERPDAIVFHSTGQALESEAQDMYNVLVLHCRIVPTPDYVPVPTPGLPRVAIFRRHDVSQPSPVPLGAHP